METFLTTFFSSAARLDETILYTVQSIGPVWKTTAWFLSHGLGSYPIMIAVLVVALLLIEKRRIALEIIIIAAISFVAIYFVKDYFNAPRPYTIDSSVIVYEHEDSPGLPSRHAVMSMIVLGWLVLKHPKSQILIWGSGILIVLIGFSRIYLGVHYPSQVLAGWLFGILFLYIFYIVDKRLWSPFKKQIRK
ncbi:MAG TPA: phosphatase PAP2 family protein [Candidatus Paceibacterota bacterium]